MNLSMNTSTAVFLSVLCVSIVYLVKDSTDKGCSIRCTRDNNGKVEFELNSTCIPPLLSAENQS